MIRKSMPSGAPDGWVPVFPRDKREAFALRSCSNKKIERDEASKKSRPALVTMAGANVGFGDTHMFQQTAKTDPSKVTHLNRE